jgi:hypothetical protein
MQKKEKKPRKKQTRRSKNPYRALDPNLNLRSRWEEISDLASYAHKLNPKEKEWLNKFSSEYICAEFGEKPIHKTKKQRKQIYDKNNARNRCVLTKSHAYGNTLSLSDVNIDKVKTKKRHVLDGGSEEVENLVDLLDDIKKP